MKRRPATQASITATMAAPPMTSRSWKAAWSISAVIAGNGSELMTARPIGAAAPGTNAASSVCPSGSVRVSTPCRSRPISGFSKSGSILPAAGSGSGSRAITVPLRSVIVSAVRAIGEA